MVLYDRTITRFESKAGFTVERMCARTGWQAGKGGGTEHQPLSATYLFLGSGQSWSSFCPSSFPAAKKDTIVAEVEAE